MINEYRIFYLRNSNALQEDINPQHRRPLFDWIYLYINTQGALECEYSSTFQRELFIRPGCQNKWQKILLLNPFTLIPPMSVVIHFFLFYYRFFLLPRCREVYIIAGSECQVVFYKVSTGRSPFTRFFWPSTDFTKEAEYLAALVFICIFFKNNFNIYILKLEGFIFSTILLIKCI